MNLWRSFSVLWLLAACLIAGPLKLSAWGGETMGVDASLRSAEIVQERLIDNIRIEFARAESMLRGGDASMALPLFDRIVETLETVEELDEEGRLLLVRGLRQRALLYWQQDLRQAADTDLDQLVLLDPSIELDPRRVPEGFLERFRRRKARLVGYLRFAIFPTDAHTTINGELLDLVPDLMSLARGDYVIEASRPGYAPAREQVTVEANRTTGVGLTLQRASAVLRLRTRPAGATVRLDGDVVGYTRGVPTGDSEASLELIVEGLLPGRHELEIELAGFRPIRTPLDIPDLEDYSLGEVEIAPARGLLLIRGLPSGTEVRINGEVSSPTDGAMGDSRPVGYDLPIGDYDVSASHPVAGVFETTAVIADGGTALVEANLQPGLAFLGVHGGDGLGADAVRRAVSNQLGSLPGWFLLDREVEGTNLLHQSGLRVQRLRAVAKSTLGGLLPADSDLAGSWARLQRQATNEIPAQLFVAIVLSDDGISGRTDLWVLPAIPGTPLPWRTSAEMKDDMGLRGLVDGLTDSLPGERSWLGALLVDSELASGPIVFAVSEGSPAANAGLRVGDELVSVDGSPINSASDVEGLLGGRAPYSNVTLDLRSAAGRRSVGVIIGSSPLLSGLLLDQHPAPLVWAALTAALRRSSSTVPRWTLQVELASFWIREGDNTRARDTLQGVLAPSDQPLGQALVDYLLGIALAAGDEAEVEAAIKAFDRAASQADGRTLHNDGPLIAPRAWARLEGLRLR